MKPTAILAFSARDLLASRRALATTAAVFFTVLVVCGFTLAAYSLAIGSGEVQTARLEHEPLALCLHLGNVFEHGKFRQRDIDLISAWIRDQVPRQRDFRGGFPFRVTEFLCRGGEGEMQRVRSRTIRLGDNADPLAATCPLQGGHLFPGADEEGGVVSPSLLRQLGMEAVPERLMIEWNARPVPLRVLRIMKNDLPKVPPIILPEAYEQRLWTAEPDKSFPRYFSGPMHAKWPEPAKSPRLLQAAKELDIEATLLSEGERYLELVPSEPGARLRLSDWRMRLRKLHDVFWAHTGEARPEFYLQGDDRGQPAAPGAATGIAAADGGIAYDMATFYFAKASAVVTVADKLEQRIAALRGEIEEREASLKSRQSAGNQAEWEQQKGILDAQQRAVGHLAQLSDQNREIVSRIRGIERSAQGTLKVLNMFEILLVTMAVYNVLVIQWMRAVHKSTEAGMLKAIGMTKWSLVGVVLTQAVYVWLVGALVGMGGGAALGSTLAAMWYPDNPTELRLAFACSWSVVGTVFLGSGVACLASSLLATLPWHFRSPATLLAAN
jgi:hypothetical protein